MSGSIEREYRVWGDQDGVSISVGPDSDTGEMLSIRVKDGNSQKFFGIADLVLDSDFALKLAEAIEMCAEDLMREYKTVSGRKT